MQQPSLSQPARPFGATLTTWLKAASAFVVRAAIYIFGGHVILAAGQAVASVGARIAATALFFASLWVAGESTVHPFMAAIVRHIPFLTTDMLDNLALTAFTWLPEIIVLEALLKTVFFAIDLAKGQRRIWSSVWCAIYAPLTSVFIWIAISTFLSYIQADTAATHTDKQALLIRALMAWIYATIELAYPAIHKKMYGGSSPTQSEPGEPVNHLRAWFTQAMEEVNRVNQQVNQETRDLVYSTLNQVNLLNQNLFTEVNRLAQQVHLEQDRSQALEQTVERALQDLTHQSEVILDTALERLEHHNSQRFQAVHASLERVTVTLEEQQSQLLPALQARLLPPRQSSGSPRRSSEPAAVNLDQDQEGTPSPFTAAGMNQQESEPSEPGNGSLPGFDNTSKVNLARQFTLEHYRASGSLPSLALIIHQAQCSKTLASRAYNLAKVDLGLK